MSKTKHQLITSRTEFFYYAFRNIFLVGLPMVLISGFILSLPHSSATFSGASSDNLTLSLPTSCTLSSVVNTAHNATLISGTYTTDIGKTTIKTLCNDGNGYAIYANGFSNDTAGNNVLVSNISNGHNMETGVYTQGTSDSNVSSWSMRLDNIVDDTSPTPPVIEEDYDGIYGLVPNTWTKVAGRQSGTTNMITGSSFTTTYAVYTAPTQHAGTYTGQVAYALIHGSGDSSVPIYIMQDVASWKDSLVEDESVQAADIRDSKVYWVTKLKDGHIWMTQNLDFDINSDTTLNSNNTDLNVIYNNGQFAEYNSGYTQVDNVIYWKPKNSTLDFVGGNGTSISGWSDSNKTPYSANKTDDTNTSHASLGNYYNWTAAIASNDSSILTSNTINDISQNPQNSICPKGWRLPTISSQSGSDVGSTNEFARLNNLYTNNFTIWKASPLFFSPAGAIEGGKYFANGMRYSSSTLESGGRVYFMQALNNYAIQPSVLYDRGFGRSVRCVAR